MCFSMCVSKVATNLSLILCVCCWLIGELNQTKEPLDGRLRSLLEPRKGLSQLRQIRGKFTVRFKGCIGDFQEVSTASHPWSLPNISLGGFLYHFYLHGRVQGFVQFWKAVDFLTEPLALAVGLRRGELSYWLNPQEYSKDIHCGAGKSQLKCLKKSTKLLMKNTFKNQSVSI